jgi:polyhydroxyalkanoate synthase subunit PhaE
MTQAFRPEAAFSGAAEHFFELMKSFAPQPSGGTGATAADPADLAGALARQYEEWLRATQSAGSWFAAPAAGATSGAFAPGAMPWPFAPLPLGMGAAVSSEGQRAWELIAQLAQLQAQLAAHWHEIATTASQQFIARLGAASHEAPTLERSLKLYELWVDCAEEAYAATVRRDDFASLQSRLANISAALLLEQRRHAETVARAFGLPTRTEVDAIYAQLKELQKRLSGLAPAAPVPPPSGAEAANEPVRGATARGAAARGKHARGKGGRRAARARGRRA